MKKLKNNPSASQEHRWQIKNIALAVLWGAVACGLLLCGFALLLAVQDLPLGIVQPFTVFSLICGCFVAGYIASRRSGQRGMLTGGLCGGTMFLCLLAAQGFCAGPLAGAATLAKLAMMLTSGMIGGIFGVNRRR